MTEVKSTFDEFVQQRQAHLLRFATMLTGDRREADEIVADALAKVWERWDRITGIERPNAYVNKMVLNEYLSWRRRLHRAGPLTELADYPDQFGDHATVHAERSALIQQLAQLPRKQRAAIVLRFDEGLADDEIAELLGCSAVTVRSNISRALATLRIRMDVPRTPTALVVASAPPPPANSADAHAYYRRPTQATSA